MRNNKYLPGSKDSKSNNFSDATDIYLYLRALLESLLIHNAQYTAVSLNKQNKRLRRIPLRKLNHCRAKAIQYREGAVVREIRSSHIRIRKTTFI